MATKNLLAKLIILLGFVSAGVQGAWAVSPSFWIKDVGYYAYTSASGVGVADVVSYRGNAETLTIPAYVNNGSITYQVKCIKYYSNDTPVDISTVKTLIFEGAISFSGQLGYPTFDCPALENIIFKAGVPNLTDRYSRYFGSRTGITAHVTGKTDDEIAVMKDNTTVWSDFADIVPYNEAVSETVNVYLTVEHAWVKVDDTSIATQGTETRSFQKNKHGNFTFEANNNYFTYDLYEVYVNGKNIKDEMTQSDSWNQYTIPDITSDVYIRIVGKQPGKDCWAAATEGATVTIKVNDETAKTITEYSYFSHNMVSTDQVEITFTPDEGYELYKFYYGVSNIMDASQLQPVAQGDGSYKITFTFGTLTYNLGSLAGCNLLLVFKPTGSGSGSGTSPTTFDLNGDGTVDVSDIDKLIEEINKQ